MSFQKSLAQPFVKNRLTVAAGFRAYFAPYNKALGSDQADTTQGPKILDLTAGPFLDSSLPSGWFDLGWIKDAVITPQTAIGSVRSGYRGAVRTKYVGMVGEKIEFKFREASRMAYKIASGKQVFNILANTAGSTVGPISASGSATYPMVSYSAVTPSVTVNTGLGASFTVGDYIVCDIDYATSMYGLVGDAGAAVFNGQVVDTNYIRLTSDYVARVKSIAGDVLTLDKKFAGGGSGDPTATVVPQAGSKVQKILGWTAREGGSTIMEYSGLFLLDTIDGGQLALYYPHLAPDTFKGWASWAIENIGTTDLTGYELDCALDALAFDDPEDGETAVRYAAYYMPKLTQPGLG